MTDSRLNTIINFVPPNSRVADIGTDHGYLPIELVKQKKSFQVIATDKNFYPALAAKKNISSAGFEKNSEVRQGDGLKVLQTGEVEIICIAGMGGKLISEILAASTEIVNSAEKLILQPMNAADYLKIFLSENNWLIEDEDLAEENGIIYEIICATKKTELIKRPTKKETSPLLKKFYAQKIEKLQRVLNEMKKSSIAVTTEKFLNLQKEITLLEMKQNAIFDK